MLEVRGHYAHTGATTLKAQMAWFGWLIVLIDGDWMTARQNYMHCYWKRYCRLHCEHHAVVVPRTCMFLVALVPIRVIVSHWFTCSQCRTASYVCRLSIGAFYSSSYGCNMCLWSSSYSIYTSSTTMAVFSHIQTALLPIFPHHLQKTRNSSSFIHFWKQKRHLQVQGRIQKIFEGSSFGGQSPPAAKRLAA